MARYAIIISLVLFFVVHNTFAQGLPQAQRWIKVGNTLRETKQYKESQKYLELGASLATKLNDSYWQAVAYENLGLLYRDKNELSDANRYFRKALEIYKTTKTSISVKALQQLCDGMSGVNSLYGGIEIGARGVKATVVGIKLNPDGNYQFSQLYSTSINTSPSLCTSSAFKETAQAVKALLDTILNRDIPKERIFVVGSSGLKNELEKPECGKTEELLNLIKEAVGNTFSQPITFIDACREAELEMSGTISASNWSTSSIIDIGSGNIKGGYFQNDNFTCIDLISIIPFVKYVNAGKKDRSFVDAANGIYKEDIGPNLITPEISRKPFFQLSDKTYFIGGIVYAMTTYLFPEQFNKQEVNFTFNNVEEFKRRAINDYNKLINPDLTNIQDEELYAKIKKATAKPIFNQEELIAGAILLEGLLTEFKKTRASREYTFNRNGYTGWITGYIVNLVNKEYQQTKEL